VRALGFGRGPGNPGRPRLARRSSCRQRYHRRCRACVVRCPRVQTESQLAVRLPGIHTLRERGRASLRHSARMSKRIRTRPRRAAGACCPRAVRASKREPAGVTTDPGRLFSKALSEVVRGLARSGLLHVLWRIFATWPTTRASASWRFLAIDARRATSVAIVRVLARAGGGWPDASCYQQVLWARKASSARARTRREDRGLEPCTQRRPYAGAGPEALARAGTDPGEQKMML
jgi:hypothetical protein